MRKILKKGEMYLDVAIKMAISLALAGLLWNTIPILVGKPFLSMPANGLIKEYSYSNNKNTYKNTVKDTNMLNLSDISSIETDPAEKTTVAYPTVPTAPTNPTLSQDGTNISVSWSAPLSDGGASICGYHIYVDDSLVTQDLITELQYTITGINTSKHKIAITAVNKEGESEKATAYFQTKALVPDAPINLSVKTSGTTATVSWSAPASNGGSKILGYNLYRNNTKVNQNLISGTTYSCKNLKAGTYTFYVTAINKVGSSQESSSVTIEIKTKPDSPTNVNAAISGTKINVSWNQPENNGGSQILGYNIYINNKKQNSMLVASDSFSFTPDVSGGYKVYVTAVNEIGESEAAGSEILTISAFPGIPTNLKCEVTDNQEIKITWQKPDETGNNIITGYNVYLDGTKLNPSPVSIEGTADTGVYLTSSGQSPGIHSVAVSAINGYGEGDKAYKAVSIFIGPSAPQAFTVLYTRNNINKITASWSDPASNGGLDILGYNLYIDGKKQNSDLITDYTYSMGLLSPGTYMFEVRAVNAASEGESATKQLIIAPETYTISLTADTGGTVSGGGTYTYGSTATIKATANSGYQFEKWSDGNTAPSRIINVTKNVNLIAYFKQSIFTLSGVTKNAQTGKILPSVSLSFKQNGMVLKTLESDANGQYSIDLPMGTYTVYSSKSGYISSSLNIILNANDVENFTLSPIMDNSEFRIVLTWGTIPRDLDAHLTGGSKEVYYGLKSISGITLDTDKTAGYGPETITIKPINGRAYIYGVKCFTGNFRNSSAKVQIYNKNSLLQTYYVNPSLTDNWWKVFSLENGQITTINQYYKSNSNYLSGIH